MTADPRYTIENNDRVGWPGLSQDLGSGEPRRGNNDVTPAVTVHPYHRDILDALRKRFGRAARFERRLRRLGEARYWTRRARRQTWRRRLSSVSLGIRRQAEEMRQDTRVLRPLLWRVLYYTFFAVAVLVGVNALAAWLSRFFHPGSLLASVTDSSFSTPVVAAVGALAVFLALFFTTVGVIASTAYANVPGEIRQLFVRERTSTFYVGVVVTSLIWGTALLTFPVVSGLQVRGLTIVFFWVLTVVAIVSLAVLGKNLFNFFDPSTLALRLYSQFVRALRRASGARRDIPDEVEQQLAHRQAASALSAVSADRDPLERARLSRRRRTQLGDPSTPLVLGNQLTTQVVHPHVEWLVFADTRPRQLVDCGLPED